MKTRFAPSPTGELHLGNVRTALFNALLARRERGVFLLRIEDTDRERSEARYVAALEEDLHWLGLDWQQGPHVGGPDEPYLQSERGAVYARYYDLLEREGLSYPCFCTVQMLESTRGAQRRAGQPPRYPGTCAHLSASEVQERLEQGLEPTLRFRVPSGCSVQFDDLVRGPQCVASDDIGDFVIRRADGTPSFFFSNAVDDALMGVTHVLRGEDHLSNTPRQLLLLQALELPSPLYGHISMIVTSSGSPLSKRHGSRSVRELRARGFLPGAILNHLARLGHSYPDGRYLGLDDLADGFDIGRLGKAPARHDEVQLDHWQKQAIAALDDQALWKWMSQGAGELTSVPDAQISAFVQGVRDNVLVPADARLWAARLYGPAIEYAADARSVISAAGVEFFRVALAECADDSLDFGSYAKKLAVVSGVKGKQLFMPLRAALTGIDPHELIETDREAIGWQHGPELRRIWELMGPQRLGARLQAALELCETS